MRNLSSILSFTVGTTLMAYSSYDALTWFHLRNSPNTFVIGADAIDGLFILFLFTVGCFLLGNGLINGINPPKEE